jgi:chloramphenicol-sensitive protein RarD
VVWARKSLTTLSESQRGILLALIAGVVWGLTPVYFRWVGAASPLEIVLQRVVWSVLMMAITMTLMRRWPEVAPVLRDWRRLRVLIVTAALIMANWIVFVHAVATAQVVEASLGYFINPLVSAALGVVVLRERPSPLVWCALLIAAAGVGNELVQFGSPPWLALALAFSFGLYGLLRKQVAVAADVGMLIETLVLLPFALLGLAWLARTGRSHFGDDVELSLGLVLGGLITIVPLICFAGAAVRLRLTTLSFFQYLSPSISLALAVWAFAEPLLPVRAVTFAAIWLALFVSSVDGVLQYRRAMRVQTSSPSGTLSRIFSYVAPESVASDNEKPKPSRGLRPSANSGGRMSRPDSVDSGSE